jgi:hypothetical protein
MTDENIISFYEQKVIADLQDDITKLRKLLLDDSTDPDMFDAICRQIKWCENEIIKIVGY